MAKAWNEEDYTALKTARDKSKEFGGQQMQIFEELSPIAMNNVAALKAIGADAKPKMEQWKKDGRAVFEQWAAAHKEMDSARDADALLRRTGMILVTADPLSPAVLAVVRSR